MYTDEEEPPEFSKDTYLRGYPVNPQHTWEFQSPDMTWANASALCTASGASDKPSAVQGISGSSSDEAGGYTVSYHRRK